MILTAWMLFELRSEAVGRSYLVCVRVGSRDDVATKKCFKLKGKKGRGPTTYKGRGVYTSWVRGVSTVLCKTLTL